EAQLPVEYTGYAGWRQDGGESLAQVVQSQPDHQRLLRRAILAEHRHTDGHRRRATQARGEDVRRDRLASLYPARAEPVDLDLGQLGAERDGRIDDLPLLRDQD